MSGRAEPLLIGVDVGTQSVRALLADRRGRTLSLAARPTPTRSTAPGCAEYDAEPLWAAVLSALSELAFAVPAGGAVAGVAVASLGESCFLVDAGGNTLAPAVAWFDRRTEPAAAALAARIEPSRVLAITGQHLDSTYSVFKLLWQREADPNLFARAERMLNVADWVAWRLCGEAATDASLASRTLLLDFRTRTWSAEMLSAAGLDPALLPPIHPSGARLGPVHATVLAATGLPGRPVVAVGGHDHVVGGFAAGSATPGCLLDSMGTAEALFQTLAAPPDAPPAGGFAQGLMQVTRPLAWFGAGLNSSGGAVEWLRRLLPEGDRTRLQAEMEALPPGSGGVCFLPHLAYSSAPNPDTQARGAFVGLTAETSRAALMRAVLEGLAMEARLVVEAMAAVPGVGAAETIRLIGGSTQNRLFVRIKASVLGRGLTVVEQPEATALGAALLGGIAAGVWPDLEAALADLEQKHDEVAPEPAWTARYDALYRQVHRALYPALRPVHHALSRLPGVSVA